MTYPCPAAPPHKSPPTPAQLEKTKVPQRVVLATPKGK